MSLKARKIFRVQLTDIINRNITYDDMCLDCVVSNKKQHTSSAAIDILFPVYTKRCSICKAPNVMKGK